MNKYWLKIALKFLAPTRFKVILCGGILIIDAIVVYFSDVLLSLNTGIVAQIFFGFIAGMQAIAVFSLFPLYYLNAFGIHGARVITIQYLHTITLIQVCDVILLYIFLTFISYLWHIVEEYFSIKIVWRPSKKKLKNESWYARTERFSKMCCRLLTQKRK